MSNSTFQTLGLDPALASNRTCTRGVLWAGLWLLLATGAIFSRLVQCPADILVGPHDHGLNDVTRQVVAYRTLFPAGLNSTGQLPLWNPWAMGGVPWFGNPQSGVLYPPNWLYFCLPEVVCVNWLVFFHHWWAGFGTFLLARSLGLTWLSSLGAGICFLGAPYLLAQTCEGHVSQVCLMSWMPWLWMAYERIRTGRSGGIPLVALVLSLAFFCDHVQELFYLVLIFSAFSVWDGWSHLRDPVASTGWKIPLSWGVAGLLAMALVAVELIPIAFYHRQAARAAGVTVAQASHGSLGPQSFWQLLDPFAYGGPTHSFDRGSMWWGSYWESLFSFGVGPLLLAFWAVIAARGLYPRGRLICVALIAIVFSFGDDTPLFPLLHRWLPGIGMFRAPMRALFHATFAVSLLAAIGLEHAWRLAMGEKSVARNRGLTFFKVLVILAGLGLVLAWQRVGLFKPGPADLWPQIHWCRFFGQILAVSVPLCLLWYFPRYGGFWMALCLVACGFELSLHARAATHTVPLKSWRQSNPILDRIAPDLGDGRLLAPQLLVSDREAWQRQVAKVEAYEPVPIARWGEFLAAVCPTVDPAQTLTGFQPQKLASYRKPLLDLLGVKFAAVPGHETVAPAGWTIEEQGLLPEETALRGTSPRFIKYTLLRNQTPLPRAWLSYKIESVGTSKEAFNALKQLDAHQRVVVEGSLPQPIATTGGSVAHVQMRRHGPQKIVTNVEHQQAGLLVVSELRQPGWKATVDGQPAAIYPTNFAFQGVFVPEGHHEVELTYTPPGMQLGGAISIVAGFLWLLSMMRMWGRHAKGGTERPAVSPESARSVSA